MRLNIDHDRVARLLPSRDGLHLEGSVKLSPSEVILGVIRWSGRSSGVLAITGVRTVIVVVRRTWSFLTYDCRGFTYKYTTDG